MVRLLICVALLAAVQGISFPELFGARAGATLQSAHAAPQVELYITTWCPYCQKAIKFFESRGIAYTAYDIEKDPEAARRKNQLDSRRGVPFALVNGVPIHGFSEQAYQRALDKK